MKHPTPQSLGLATFGKRRTDPEHYAFSREEMHHLRQLLVADCRSILNPQDYRHKLLQKMQGQMDAHDGAAR